MHHWNSKPNSKLIGETTGININTETGHAGTVGFQNSAWNAHKKKENSHDKQKTRNLNLARTYLMALPTVFSTRTAKRKEQPGVKERTQAAQGIAQFTAV